MVSEDLFTRFVQPGRICTVQYGKDINKVATIVDIIDQNRVLIDGPTTGVTRQSIPLRWVRLSDVVAKTVFRGCRTTTLKQILDSEKWIDRFNETTFGKKRLAQISRAEMTDFDRFKLMTAHKRRRALLRKSLRQTQ